jgi:hypothetical protein
MGNMASARLGLAAASLGGQVYVLGDPAFATLATVEGYTP